MSEGETGVVPSMRKALEAVLRLLRRTGDRGVIIGGLAASLLGRPRLTADIDAVIMLSVDQLSDLLEAAAQEGLIPRIADAVAFARQHRVLLLQHRESGIPVDISLGALPFEAEMIARRLLLNVGDLAIPVPRPEDLIVLKSVAHRPADLADIRAIAESHPEIDRKYIRRWVEAFAEVLELPHLWESIQPLLETETGDE